jgi:hypothetical protein
MGPRPAGAVCQADHANLLCSLLLGYGLEAYVAQGTSDEGGADPLFWVCTVEHSSHDPPRAVFWSALSGRRCPAVQVRLRPSAPRAAVSLSCLGAGCPQKGGVGLGVE